MKEQIGYTEEQKKKLRKAATLLEQVSNELEREDQGEQIHFLLDEARRIRTEALWG